MSTSLIENAKYSSWKETHNFDNCKLNRKEYGQFLANYLIGEKDGFVLNLNGSWGTGKTEFLKRFYIELMDRGHPTIYIDAWESDFSQEPLTVVASELLSQLERLMDGAISDGEITKVKSALGKALKGTLVGLAGIASAKLLNDSAIGMEAINKLLDEAPQNITKQLAEDYQSQIEAINTTREALGALAESLQTVNGSALPVIVLIDELDRCRPTYAIEMLEVIKHFFLIKNFVFVIATDTDQLCHSITSVYGDKFDSSQYLKRFFHRKSTLSTPNINEYIDVYEAEHDYASYDVLFICPTIHNNITEKKVMILNCISYVAFAYDLKIRDIDQLIAKVHSCLRVAVNVYQITKKKQVINIFVLVIGLIEQDMNLPAYSARTNNSSTQSPIINDRDISSDVTISQCINLSLDAITMQTSYNYQGHPVLSLNAWEYYRQIRGASPSIEMLTLTTSLSENLNLYNDEGCKFWLWTDYKKIIELAGSII
ncbi:P-loop NTPase fold protein [Aeromonas sp. MdU4]|uniref:KAP family P-loop NTPase fold protein n=1 Tax=Aeromonas sp. MdU4 TaxID=3342819 RepID=UPI0035B8EC54